MFDLPVEYARFRGSWCDNCNTAYSYMPASGNCPQCRTVKVRRAEITVQTIDLDEEN